MDDDHSYACSGEIKRARSAIVHEAHEFVCRTFHHHGAKQLARESPVATSIRPTRRIDADAHCGLAQAPGADGAVFLPACTFATPCFGVNMHWRCSIVRMRILSAHLR
jgi:hypothetical protein